jgi:cytochrome bd-type quinol oxidase subunit 2
MLDLFDLSKKGFCTPTILVSLLALVMGIALLVKLVRAKDMEERKRMSMASGSHLLWTILVAWVMFYLCSHGKREAAWWLFGLLYLLPVVAMVLVLWKCSCRGRRLEQDVEMEGEMDM